MYGAHSYIEQKAGHYSRLMKIKKIDIMAAEMWFWRRMMNISWKEKIILEELNITRELLGKVVSLKVGYFGHVVRESGSPLAI